MAWLQCLNVSLLGILLGPFRVPSSVEGLLLPFCLFIAALCAPLYARLLKTPWFDLRLRAHGIYTSRPHTNVYSSPFVHLLVCERDFPVDERPVFRSYVSNFIAAITYDRDDKRVVSRMSFNLTGIKCVHYSKWLNYCSQYFQSYEHSFYN